MKPLIESDAAVLAILLAVLALVAAVSWFAERRGWFRDQVLPPPNVRSVRPRRWNVPL